MTKSSFNELLFFRRLFFFFSSTAGFIFRWIVFPSQQMNFQSYFCWLPNPCVLVLCFCWMNSCSLLLLSWLSAARPAFDFVEQNHPERLSSAIWVMIQKIKSCYVILGLRFSLFCHLELQLVKSWRQLWLVCSPFWCHFDWISVSAVI